MTIIVLFHASAYRNFKAFYTEQVLKHYAGDFPHRTHTLKPPQGKWLETYKHFILNNWWSRGGSNP
jgi:hypothetical protein